MFTGSNGNKNPRKISGSSFQPQTKKELATLGRIRQYNLEHHLAGNLLPKHNEMMKYYIFEVGFILKYDLETGLCKRLDLEKMEWVPSQSSISLFYDTTYDFRELAGFQDYYPDRC